jgi:excinuclease ABC subunit C
LLSSFLLQYYAEAPILPTEVLVPHDLEDAETLAEILGEQRGTKVTVRQPQRGEKKALLDIASRNARSSFEEKRLAKQANEDLLEQIREKLHLSRTPERIECFDISTTQGEKAVASMAVFQGGVPAKQRYRHYAIRKVEGQDDFAMMREVLLRRYKRAIEESDLPDLILVDGGKGQLGVATAVLADLGIEDLDAAGIAKSRLENGDRSPERFFVPGRKNPIVLPQNSPIVHLMARVRDEAHRFANTYHRKRRGKAVVRTALVDIPGVGPKRARTLLNRLGSVARIRAASVEDLAEVPGISTQMAQIIKDHLAEGNKQVVGGDA